MLLFAATRQVLRRFCKEEEAVSHYHYPWCTSSQGCSTTPCTAAQGGRCRPGNRANSAALIPPCTFRCVSYRSYSCYIVAAFCVDCPDVVMTPASCCLLLLQVATCLCSKLLAGSIACSFANSQTSVAAAALATTGLRLLRQQTANSIWRAPYHTSSMSSQQQQQDSDKRREQSIHEQSQEVSKSFITSVLNMEEAWLSGVAGQLKMWAATKKVPELEVSTLQQPPTCQCPYTAG